MGRQRARRRPRRRPRTLLISIGLTLLLAVVPATLYVWGSRSSTFVIHTVVVEGTQRSSQQRAQRLLEKRFRGRNLFVVEGEDVERALSPLRFVSGVTIDRDFPSTLRVRVREHVPAAYVLAGRRWYLVSRRGVVLGEVREESRKPAVALEKGPRDVIRRLPAVCAAAPRLRRGSTVADDAVKTALRVLRTLPDDLRRRVAAVCRSGSGVRLRLRDGARVDLGPTTRLAAKATALGAVLSYYEEQKVAATYVDVSVPDRPVGRPML